MAETTLQARIGPYPSANLSPKKAWKKQKPYIDNHQQATAWQHTKKPYHRDDGHRPSAHALPSLFDRLGLPPPAQPRSLLERIEVDGAMDHMEVVKTDVVHSSDRAFIPSEAAQPGKMDIEEDGEVQDEVPRRCDSDQEDGEVRTGGQPRKRPVPTSFLWNGFSPAIANPPSRVPPILTITSTGENNSDVCQSKSNSGHAINPTSEAAVVDSLLPDSENDSFVAARKVPESQVNTNHFNVYDGDMVMPLAQPESLSHLDASRVQNRLPLQERVSRALRSIVFENAKMRETKGTVDWNKAQSKIDKLVTGPVSESFLAQMKKVREEMDARRAGPKIDETMARAKDDLSIGFGGKGGPGGHSDNTWLTKGRDGNSLFSSVASTSILPTPPSSLNAESMAKDPPTAPRAMMALYVPPAPVSLENISRKGKEKAREPGHDGSAKRRNSDHSILRAETMQNGLSDSVPPSARSWTREQLSSHDMPHSPTRPISRSPSQSPVVSHRRSFADEMPTYHSPSRPLRARTYRSPLGRRASLRSRSRSHSRSPVRPTPASATSRRPFRSPSRSPIRSGRRLSPRSGSRPRRAVSHTRSFNGRPPSYGHSPVRSGRPPSPGLSRSGRAVSHSRSFDGRRPSYSRSPVRSGRLPSPGSSRPLRDISPTHSFGSRRPPYKSVSHSPPPSASFSHGSGPRLTRRSRSHSSVRELPRGRAYSDKPALYYSRSRSPALNSRYSPRDKRPLVRSPSPHRGRRGHSLSRDRSGSPLSRKRKLTHPSPGTRSRSPLVSRRRSPSSGPYTPDEPHRGRHPLRRDTYADDQDPAQLASPFTQLPPPATRAPDSPPAPVTRTNPCNNVPGLWFVKVGATYPRILEGAFFVEPDLASEWDLDLASSPTIAPPKRPPEPKLSIMLLCLPTEDVFTLYKSLAPSNPTPEMIAAAVVKIETKWPRTGTLLLEINKQESGGRTWLPSDITHACPLDVTSYIRPGPNIIRIIQLASMGEHTFILYASRRPDAGGKDPSNTSLAELDVALSTQPTDTLFIFHASMTIS